MAEVIETWEYTCVYPDMIVSVDKVGGGTLGKEYVGTWDVRITDEYGTEDLSYTTRMPHEHEWVANEVYSEKAV